MWYQTYTIGNALTVSAGLATSLAPIAKTEVRSNGNHSASRNHPDPDLSLDTKETTMAHNEDYEDDRGERSRAGSALQGVCKDCGNGTLNNSISAAFGSYEDGPLVCLVCGSTHLDIL